MLNPTISDQQEFFPRFYNDLQILVGLYREEGLTVSISPANLARERFERWPDFVRARICSNLNRFLVCAQEMKAAGVEIGRDRNRKLLWRIFSKMGWVPPANLFDHLEDSDVIEVYDHDLIQVYRNTRFLELCTYPLDQIFTSQFTELFDRDNQINQEVLRITQRVLTGQSGSIELFTKEPHIVREMISTEHKCFKVVNGLAAPIKKSDGEVQAILYTLKAEEMSP